ncbi:hypothetical protein TRIUR3_28395 [Triticum urartu]|uniref:Uncharacterized protein n=1 Tax=Triticum urartu TaxID=4572 RepID=M8A4K1_TRIUA|nr:hypothetical protein TRIUR3_28395 [Triticum urartu]
MDATERRLRAVSAHLQPQATAARRTSDSLAPNPTAGEYAHGTHASQALSLSSPARR